LVFLFDIHEKLGEQSKKRKETKTRIRSRLETSPALVTFPHAIPKAVQLVSQDERLFLDSVLDPFIVHSVLLFQRFNVLPTSSLNIKSKRLGELLHEISRFLLIVFKKLWRTGRKTT